MLNSYKIKLTLLSDMNIAGEHQVPTVKSVAHKLHTCQAAPHCCLGPTYILH